jgi:hypothetical protein
MRSRPLKEFLAYGKECMLMTGQKQSSRVNANIAREVVHFWMVYTT